MIKKDNLLDSTRNIFLTGQAGTGKTYLIRQFLDAHQNCIVAASTGTAAVDIGGVTMHRLFSVPVPAYGANPDDVPASKLKVFEFCETIIIDEISMCRNDVFSFAMRILHRAEKLYGHNIRVIVCGDFSQLPPVVRKEEERYFTRYGFDKSGYAFTTVEWAEMKFKVVHLDEIKRQSDLEFTEQLGLVRVGDVSCLPYFERFVTDEVPANAVFVCGTNREADAINTQYLDGIDNNLVLYTAQTEGKVFGDLPCDEQLLLKEDARVMFTVNDTESESGIGRFQNGTCGYIVSLRPDYVDVMTDDGETIRVFRHKWTLYEYKTDKGTGMLSKQERGAVWQIPLKVAKAITIHKSQGKTFSQVVISPTIFASGQLYVALSRVTSPEGLYLTAPIRPEYLMTDKVVAEFYRNGFTYTVPEAIREKQKAIAKQMEEASKNKKTAKKTASRKKPAAKKPARHTSAKKEDGKKKAVSEKKTSTSKRTATSAKKKKAAKKPAAKRTVSRKTARKSPAKKSVRRTKSSSGGVAKAASKVVVRNAEDVKKEESAKTKAYIKRLPPAPKK